MRSLLLILLLLFAAPVLAVDVYVDGHKLQGVIRVDIATEQAAAELPRVQPGDTPNWPETEQPPLQGDPAAVGYAEQPIARWHVPCFETYQGPHVIGLLAFHACGIAHGDEGIHHVELIANAGAPVAITAPTRHPTLGYWGWWAELQPAAADGLVEVRAVVYPHDGRPRVLAGGYVEQVASKTILPTTEQTLLLWSNAGGTYTTEPRHVATTGSDETGDGTAPNPFATIAKAAESYASADHATIHLAAGIYLSPRESTAKNGRGWLTIRPAAGVARDQVTLAHGNGSGNSHLLLVRLQDLTIARTAGPELFRGRSTALKLHLWLDGCAVSGTPDAGLIANGSAVAFHYLTRSSNHRTTWTGFSNGPNGRQLTYGCDARDITGDIFTGNAFTRDFTIRNHHRLPGQHSDLWQGRAGPPNRILCDGQVHELDAQVYFYDNGRTPNTDAALVNVACHYGTGGAFASQFGNELRHVLIWHCANNQRLLFRDNAAGALCETFSVNGNSFGRFQFQSRGRTLEQATARGWHWSNNAFSGTTLPGTGETASQTTTRTVRWDARQNERGAITARGALNGDL